MRSSNLASTTFFSITPTRGGVTDQLQEFLVLYQLGHRLGYTYDHRAFQTNRSSRPHGLPTKVLRKLFWKAPKGLQVFFPEAFFDIYDFLGFNTYFERLNRAVPRRSFSTVDMVLNDQVFEDQGVQTLAQLEDYVRRRVEEPRAEASPKPLRVHFRLTRDIQWFQWFDPEGTAEPVVRHLRCGYREARQSNPRPSPFEKGKLKLLVHIRQGDTGVVETPWGTFVPVWGRMKGWMQEYEAYDAIPGHALIPIKYFAAFVEAMEAAVAREQVSTVVFSDGFERAFRVMKRQAHRLAWTSAQHRAVQKLAGTYDARQFARFNRYRSCRCIIGEGGAGLSDLIQAAVEAEVVVVGTQQNMVAKLMAGYHTQETMPVVVVLYRKEKPAYDGLSLGARAERFVFVDVEQESMVEAASRVIKGLASRSQGDASTYE